MFHAGDLSSGISLAIAEHKLVACLVRADDNYWSDVWEHHWLAHPSTPNPNNPTARQQTFGEKLGEKAVLLRLDYGSKEASFLSAFCKIERAPTFVVIRDGEVLEKLEGGVEQGEWIERVVRAVGWSGSAGGGEEGAQEDEDEEDEVEEQDEDEEDEVEEQDEAEGGDAAPGSPAYTARAADMAAGESEVEEAEDAPAQPVSQATPSSAPQHSTSSAQPTSSSQTPSTLFPDRAQRLEAEKLLRDAAEKAERQARQDARRQEAEEAYAANRGGTDKGKGKGKQPAITEDADKQRARHDWIFQQKQRKDQATQDRARILAQIEADKAERRLRRANAKQAEVQAGAGTSSPMPDERIAASRRSAGAGGVCHLQIRLFDGSSVRHRFPTATTTLGKGVREWITQQASPAGGAADVPYTFRQMQAPRPARSIGIGEEHQTLGELELAPSATLVLVPVAGYTEAYAAAGRNGNGHGAGGVWGYGRGLVNGVWSQLPNVGYYLPSFSRLYMAGGGGGTGEPQQPQEGRNVPGAAAGKVKTLADRRADEEKKKKQRDPPEQFYNGNSLKFEERGDGDGDGEGL
ncbi:hypothetical protein LTR36_005530 [Oleoguttula mirabilis]|uniref:UBX domain-containing protein 2 n=1 Tax=Oleoguttula mirabilis TaxID=1507867 RepID=A0AAV9JDV0_9PEZI|nr:hypothetical protein LTR36_005530 [Oleoguttula mirabilis]